LVHIFLRTQLWVNSYNNLYTSFLQGHSLGGSGSYVSMSGLNNLKIKNNGVQLGTTLSSVSQNDNIPVNFILPAGVTKTVDVFADIGSVSSGIIQLSIIPTGTGTSGTVYPTAVYTSTVPVVDGQVITIQ